VDFSAFPAILYDPKAIAQLKGFPAGLFRCERQRLTLVGTPDLARKLGFENVNLLDNGLLRQELGGLCHECRSYPTREVCLSTRFVREGVKDTERRRSKADRKPGGRC